MLEIPLLPPMFAVGGLVALVVCGLVGANTLRDRGVDPSTCRRVAGALGGGAYLITVLSFDPFWAIAASAVATLLVLALRLGFRRHLRGIVQSDGLRWGELAYLIAGMISLLIGWGLLGDRWLAFVPIAFMAW